MIWLLRRVLLTSRPTLPFPSPGRPSPLLCIPTPRLAHPATHCPAWHEYEERRHPSHFTASNNIILCNTFFMSFLYMKIAELLIILKGLLQEAELAFNKLNSLQESSSIYLKNIYCSSNLNSRDFQHAIILNCVNELPMHTIRYRDAKL